MTQRQGLEVLTHGFSIFQLDRSVPEAVDDMDDNPLCVSHDGILSIDEIRRKCLKVCVGLNTRRALTGLYIYSESLAECSVFTGLLAIGLLIVEDMHVEFGIV